MMMLQDKLPKDPASAMALRDRLDKASDTKRDDFSKTIGMLNLKNPTTGLILSLFLGGFGADRFYKGDIGLGVLKIILLIVSYSLLFLGMAVVGFFSFFVWAVADIFFVYKGIKKDNLAKVMTALSNV